MALSVGRWKAATSEADLKPQKSFNLHDEVYLWKEKRNLHIQVCITLLAILLLSSVNSQMEVKTHWKGVLLISVVEWDTLALRSKNLQWTPTSVSTAGHRSLLNSLSSTVHLSVKTMQDAVRLQTEERMPESKRECHPQGGRYDTFQGLPS